MRSRTVLAIAALLFAWNVWGYDLWAPDEPYFGEGAREMIADGRWAVPHVNGVVTTDKPPVFFWLIALFSLPLGEVVSVTARLPSILAALGTLALTMRLGRRMATPRTAALAGFTLCTLYMFWEKARWAQIDATLCFLIWVALSAFAAFRAGEADGRRAGLLFWAAAALAVLAKGPVGLLLPLGIALVTLAVDRDLGAWRRFAPWSGPGLFALLVGAWMVLATVGGGGEYSVWGALREHFIERGVGGMHHEQPWWYYGRALPLYLLPWTGLVPAAFLLAGRRRDRDDRFLLVATLFVVLFFTVSTEKRELYTLPAFPAFALLLARAAGHWLGWEESPPRPPAPRWFSLGMGWTAALLLLGGLALPFVARGEQRSPYWIALGLSAIIGLGGLATAIALARRRRLPTVLAPAVGFTVAYLFAATWLFPALNASKSSREFATLLARETAASRAAGHAVLTHELENLPEAFAFYTGGLYTVETDVEERAQLIEHLRQEARVFAAIHAGYLDALPADLRATLVEVARRRLSRRDVVLVANR